MNEKSPQPEVKHRRNIKIVETNGYHQAIADDEYGLAKFFGQTGLLIPLKISRAIGHDKIIELLNKNFGEIMIKDEINQSEEYAKSFVIPHLPTLWEQTNDGTGKFEENKELRQKIDELIRDIEDAYEETTKKV